MRPDLTDPEQRRRYRAELIRLKRGWRMAGVALCCAGAAAMITTRFEEVPTPGLCTFSWVAVAAGFAIFAYVIAYRTRYHRRRIGEE